MDDVLARVPREEMFARTGIQFLPLNTIYQLAAHQRDGFPAQARRLLLIPDLCHHFLCGSRLGERTNASTTQLLDVRTGAWDDELFDRLGLGAIRPLMPDLVNAGAELGMLGHSSSQLKMASTSAPPASYARASSRPRHTIPRAPSPARRSNRAGRSSRPARGRWSASNATRPSSIRRPRARGSPTKRASTARCVF